MSTNKVEVAFSSYLMCFRMPIALLALALWTTTVSHNNHGIKPQMGFLIAQNNFKCGQISVCRVRAKQNTRQRRNAFLLFGKQPELILGKKKTGFNYTDAATSKKGMNGCCLINRIYDLTKCAEWGGAGIAIR